MVRIYHAWDKWECYRAGFYRTTAPDGMTPESALASYAEFLRDTPRFESALARVTAEWEVSCEQFLSNENINRIAWLGQASMCIATGVPAVFRAGFKLLTESERQIANETAAIALRSWLDSRSDLHG